ncbi:MAG: outer membrane protein assembly factor BamE [Pseudomonadota bacterium]
MAIMARVNIEKRWTFAALALGCALLMSGCNSTKQVLSHGYQLNEESLQLVPEGSSRDQVLLTLGTPSTTQQQLDGTETFYYISLKKSRPVAFARPRVVDQRVLAIYLGQDDTVTRIANYGLKDGKVFDFVRRVTPTGGRELSFVSQLLRAATGASPANILPSRNP